MVVNQVPVVGWSGLSLGPQPTGNDNKNEVETQHINDYHLGINK
jgi:hypothetical protein